MSVTRGVVALLAGVIVGSTPLAAQGVGTIRGRVVDSTTAQGLPNVSVTIAGTRFGTQTGPDGGYTIARVPAGAQRLQARRIGYRSGTVDVTVTAGGTVTVDVALSQQASVLTEMVVTGYGTQRREQITGSVSTVNADQANVGVITNATQLIEGRSPGVQIVLPPGSPLACTI
jgi:hypothetical protein